MSTRSAMVLQSVAPEMSGTTFDRNIEWANAQDRRVRKLDVLFLAEDDEILQRVTQPFTGIPYYPTIEDCYEVVEGINRKRYRN